MDPSTNINLRAHLLATHGAQLRPFLTPRAYRPVPGFAIQGVLDAAVAHAAAITHHSDRPEFAGNVIGFQQCAVLAQLARYGMPIYAVGQDIQAAMQLSRLPGDLPLSDLRMPFPAMTFVLNQATALRTPDGTLLDAIAIAHLPGGPMTAPWPGSSRGPLVLANNTDPNPTDELIITAWSSSANLIYAVCYPWLGTIGTIVSEVSSGDEGADISPLGVTTPLPRDDNDLLVTIALLALKFTLFAAQGPRPLVEDPVFIKRARFGGREKVDLYEPRWLGRTYRLPNRSRGDESSASHASPRMHWRCGHLRRTPAGPDRQERRIVWIEPTLVNASAASAPRST